MNLKPIGIVHSPFKEMSGTPIQPAFAGGAEGAVEVFSQFRDGLADLDGFDRIWLIYWFDRVSEMRLRVRPYLDDHERGLFSTRAPCRPNPIGMSYVRLLDVTGNTLRVAELDILDGTPLLDIKPCAPRLDHFEVRRCGWMKDATGHRTVSDDRFAIHAETSDAPGQQPPGDQLGAAPSRG